MNVIWKLGKNRVSFYVGIEREKPLFSFRYNAAELSDSHAAQALRWLRQKMPDDDFGVLPVGEVFVRAKAYDVTWPRVTRTQFHNGELFDVEAHSGSNNIQMRPSSPAEHCR